MISSLCISRTQELKHPNIIRCLGSFEHGPGTLMIVLELAEAGDLSKFLYTCQQEARSLSESTIWGFFVQIASAVEHMHSKRIVHRGLLFLFFFYFFVFVLN